MSGETILEARKITKDFPGIRALSEVSLTVRQGEVHALIGENGAGKSTLIKIFSGVYQPEEGKVFLEGRPITIDNPHDAHKTGIYTIHQELSLAPNLSISENIFLGAEKPKRFFNLLINWKKMNEIATELLNKIGVEGNPARRLGSLNIAEQQLTEIAKGLLAEAKILILDEPTAALSLSEIRYIFEIIMNLKRQGMGIIYISHRLEEIFEIADRVTVLRDGKKVGTEACHKLDLAAISRMMTGKVVHAADSLSKTRVLNDPDNRREVLKVQNLVAKGVNNISFVLHAGEVLGLAGLMGSGRTELARAIYGVNKIISGKVFLEGREINVRSAQEALIQGIGYTTEDRKNDGLFLDQSVVANLTMIILYKLSKYGWLTKKEKEKAEELRLSYRIATPSLKKQIKFLSGGNQQKVIIARTMAEELKVIILDEPTKGVDIGAKQEIFKLVRQLADSGIAVIFISSEIEEVIDVSNRVLIMRDGENILELEGTKVTKRRVLEIILEETQ